VTDGGRLRSIELQDGDRYHPGGIAVDKVSIWIRVAGYRKGSSALSSGATNARSLSSFSFRLLITSASKHIAVVQ